MCGHINVKFCSFVYTLTVVGQLKHRSAKNLYDSTYCNFHSLPSSQKPVHEPNHEPP